MTKYFHIPIIKVCSTSLWNFLKRYFQLFSKNVKMWYFYSSYSRKKMKLWSDIWTSTVKEFTQIILTVFGYLWLQPYRKELFHTRVIGSIRREALDHFLLFSEKQVQNIIREYVHYHNHQRPHQGINKIPDGKIVSNTGIIKKERVLGGFHHHYYRSSA